MSNIISKELLSEVLGQEVSHIETDKDELYNHWSLDEEECENYIGYRVTTGLVTKNIHELAHKCKEWAYNKHGLILLSSRGYLELWLKDRFSSNDNPVKIFREEDTEEYIVIKKACQWIYDKEKK